MEDNLITTASKYESLKTFSYVVIGAYGASIFLNGAFFIFSFFRIVFQDSFLTESNGIASLIFAFINLLAVVEIPLRLLSFILLLVWTYKAYTNLHSLKSRDLEYTPGWAVGWWFIPLANLVKPYQVMGELWNASDSDFNENTFFTNYVGTPRIVGFWWAS